MRIRLWTAITVCSFATMGLLATFCRVPAGEIIIPTGTPQAVSGEAQVLPAIGSSEPVPCADKKDKCLDLQYGVTSDSAPCTRTQKDLPQLVTDPAPRVPTMLVNSRRIKLNFNITDVGPSGVSAVELWATRDGKSWQRYSNEPPPSGPLVVCVAEEGRYGFSIVVRNGIGLASPAPRTNDLPQIWVDVDETRPTVYLTDCRVGHGSEAGRLYLSWKAHDANMAARPVSLYTGVSKDGPWKKVACGIENNGSYTWDIPKDTSYKFYVRIEATDLAGNVGHAVTPEPMKCDACRPRGVIIGAEVETQQLGRITVPAGSPEQPAVTAQAVMPSAPAVAAKPAVVTPTQREQTQVFQFYSGTIR